MCGQALLNPAVRCTAVEFVGFVSARMCDDVGVTEKHFKEKLPRVLGLGNTTPDAATMTTGVRGLMFGDYMLPGDTAAQ